MEYNESTEKGKNIQFSSVRISDIVERLEAFKVKSNNCNVSKMTLKLKGYDVENDQIHGIDSKL